MLTDTRASAHTGARQQASNCSVLIVMYTALYSKYAIVSIYMLKCRHNVCFSCDVCE